MVHVSLLQHWSQRWELSQYCARSCTKVSVPWHVRTFGNFALVSLRTRDEHHFRSAGETGVGRAGKPLWYKGSPFHRIIPGFCMQGSVHCAASHLCCSWLMHTSHSKLQEATSLITTVKAVNPSSITVVGFVMRTSISNTTSQVTHICTVNN